MAAIPVFAVLFFLLLRWKKKVKKRIGDPELVKSLVKEFSNLLFAVRFLLLSAAFAIGVLAVMHLRKPGDGTGVARKGIDVVIALDVSKSMLADDVQPGRLAKAKEFTNQLLDAMPDDRIALVLFAGKAFLQMPLSADHHAARMFIDAADPKNMVQQGTVISDAMRMSSLAFNPRERRFKTVVLISDGENHDGAAFQVAEEMATRGIMINTIGIGTPQGTFFTDPATGLPKKDASGSPVISKLNEDLLRQVAAATNGAYFHLNDTRETVEALLGHLAQIEKKAYTDISLMSFSSYYWWFVAAMFVLLITEFFIPEKKVFGK